MKIYLGFRRQQAPVIFLAADKDHAEGLGRQSGYFAVAGAFRTRAAAEIMQSQWANGSPCFHTVAQCEDEARRQAEHSQQPQKVTP